MTESSSTFAIYVLASMRFLNPDGAIWAFLIVSLFHLLIMLINNTVTIMNFFEAFRAMKCRTFATCFFSLLHIDHALAIWL